MRRGASGQELVIYHEHEYNITQQKCHLELSMILTFCWQVKAEGIADNQETTGHLKFIPQRLSLRLTATCLDKRINSEHAILFIKEVPEDG